MYNLRMSSDGSTINATSHRICWSPFHSNLLNKLFLCHPSYLAVDNWSNLEDPPQNFERNRTIPYRKYCLVSLLRPLRYILSLDSLDHCLQCFWCDCSTHWHLREECSTRDLMTKILRLMMKNITAFLAKWEQFIDRKKGFFVSSWSCFAVLPCLERFTNYTSRPYTAYIRFKADNGR